MEFSTQNSPSDWHFLCSFQWDTQLQIQNNSVYISTQQQWQELSHGIISNNAKLLWHHGAALAEQQEVPEQARWSLCGASGSSLDSLNSICWARQPVCAGCHSSAAGRQSGCQRMESRVMPDSNQPHTLALACQWCRLGAWVFEAQATRAKWLFHQYFGFYLSTPSGLRRSRQNHHLVVGQSILKRAPDPPHRQGLPLFQQFVVAGGKGQTVELIQLQIVPEAERVLRGTVLTRNPAWDTFLRHAGSFEANRKRKSFLATRQLVHSVN